MIEQPKGGDWPKLGEVIEEFVDRASLENKIIWERKLRLHIKPKPDWLPESLWKKLLSLLLTQSEAGK